MEQIRDRIDAIVEDPETAAALKPYYPYGCKRPTFHDEYLPTFNRPNVTLVDVAPIGVQEINERGVVHDGVQYDLDVLIYATGFDFMSRRHVQPGDAAATGARSPTSGRKRGPAPSSGCTPTASRTCSSWPARRGRAGASTSPTPSRSTPTTWSGCSRRCGTSGHRVVDVREDDEDRWAQHCAEADVGHRAAARLPVELQRLRPGRARLARLLRRPGASERRSRGPGDAGALRLRTHRPGGLRLTVSWSW